MNIYSSHLRDSEDCLSYIGGNTGNSYITYSIIKKIYGKLVKVPDIPCIYNYDFTNSDRDADYINTNVDYVFFVLQDQIRKNESYGLKLPYQNIIMFLKMIKKPIIIVGLGANNLSGYEVDFHKKLPSDLIWFLKELSLICKNIGLRGFFSQEVLHNLGIDNTTVTGCPSYFETGKDRIITKKSNNIGIDKILLTSATPIPALQRCPQIMQDWQEKRFIDALYYGRLDKELSVQDIKSLRHLEKNIFVDIEDWKSYISSFDFAFGGRLHGTIISLNSGIPAVCFNNDARALEMCEYLKIPLVFDVNQNTDIFSIYREINLDSMNKAYPLLYENYDRFIKGYINESEISRLRNELNNSDASVLQEKPILQQLEKKPDNIKVFIWFMKKCFRKILKLIVKL